MARRRYESFSVNIDIDDIFDELSDEDLLHELQKRKGIDSRSFKDTPNDTAKADREYLADIIVDAIQSFRRGDNTHGMRQLERIECYLTIK